MKISKILMLGAIASLSLSSCVNEVFPTITAHQGEVSLSVDHLKPGATRAAEVVETGDFPVSLYEKKNNREYQSWEKASLVPNKLSLPVGFYYVKAHTPGNLKKIMEYPYYAGVDTIEVLEGITTKSTVVCRMANGSFDVEYSDDFTDAFSEWTVSIDDGDNAAIIYTDEDGLNPSTLYMEFAPNVEILNVSFVGTTVNGNRIAIGNKLTKKQASEQYDSDSEYFSGGDAIVLKLTPVESTEGDVTGIELKANISFEETEESFEMEVEDVVPEGGDQDPEPEDPETPGEGEGDAITLNLPSDMKVGADTDPSLGDTYIAATAGISSIKVKIESSSADMMGALADLGLAYEGIDFVNNGTEVVANQSMVTLFSDLGQTLSVPSVGDKDYTFPIGNFFFFLSMLPGDHTFMLTVTDMNGNSQDGQLTLTVE